MLSRQTTGQKRLICTAVSCLIFLLFIEGFAYKVMNDSSVITDFKSFYGAGYLARTTPSLLYDLREQERLQGTPTPLPYYHAAYEALLYAPFSLLPYRRAYQAFLLFNVILLALIVLVLRELKTNRIPLMSHFPGLAMFTFLPVLIALLHGQDSIVFLLLCCCCWRMYQRGNNFLAGCVLGLMLFRFQLSLPLLALLLLQRRRYLFSGFLSTSALVALVSFALVGASGLRQWLQTLSSGSLSHDNGLRNQAVMAIHPLTMPNLFGIMYAAGVNRLRPDHAASFVLVLSAGIFLWTAHRSRHMTRDGDVFATALLCSLMVSYHMYLHDLSLLILPLALLRTRAALYLGVATFALAYALPALGGADLFFLLALPVLLLLCFGWKRDASLKGATAAAVQLA